MPEHNMMHCLIPGPPLERLLNQDGLGQPRDDKVEETEAYFLWPTFLMVCRNCWEVRLDSRSPSSLDAELEPLGLKRIRFAIVIVNPGNGSCGEEDDD